MRARAMLLALLVAGLSGCLAEPTGDPEPDPTGPAPSALAWMGHPEAPSQRTEVAVAILGGKIHVVGGLAGDSGLTTHEVYDVDNETWGTAAPYPVQIHHTALVAHGGLLYAFGGYATRQFVPTALAFVYDPQTDQWNKLADLPIVRGAHAAAVVGTKAYLVGGNTAGLQLTTQVDVYDFATATWSTLGAPLPEATEHHAAAANATHVFVIGGRENSLATNKGDLQVLDTAAGTWTQGPAMPTARGGVTAQWWNGSLVVAGGEGQATFPEVEAWDQAAGNWTRLPDLPTPRHGLGSAVHEGRFYVVGGGPEPGLTVSGTIESLG